MDAVALLVASPFIVGTLLRTGRMRGVSRLYLQAEWWKWRLLIGLAAALVLAVNAHAWLTRGFVAAVMWLATWDAAAFRR